MYVKINNGSIEFFPYSATDLRLSRLDVSWPSTVSDETLADYGVYPVVATAAPPVTDTQVAEYTTPIEVDGVWTLQWTVRAMTADELAAKAGAAREAFKAQRTITVANITVTVASGKIFDGDEDSQTRMARAIIGLQAAGVPSIEWTLADNSKTLVTLAEITEALILAGQAQSAVW